MAFRLHASRTPSALSKCTALMIVDQRPIQRQIWTEFHRARKLQDKAARDLHRHELTDTPAFERWLHGVFPTLVTALRELHARVDELSRQVDAVQYMASLTGRSLKKLWREHKEYMADPEAFERKVSEAEAEARARIEAERKAYAADRPFFDEEESDDDDDFFGNFFGDDNGDGDDRFDDETHVIHPYDSPSRAAASDAARGIYRRLVQHLHPDRGGEWTPARERLWHEVQQAWNARDTDWLSRLEIEWETAHDVINENSSISRLRRAIEELHAARRDTERKLRHYRKTSAWRFTLAEKKRPQLHRRTETELRHDLDVLQRQLDYLQSTIAAWETPLPSRRTRRSRRG